MGRATFERREPPLIGGDDQDRRRQNARDTVQEESAEVRRGHCRRPGELSEYGRHQEASDDAKGENAEHPVAVGFRDADPPEQFGALFIFPVSSENDFMARFPRTRRPVA